MSTAAMTDADIGATNTDRIPYQGLHHLALVCRDMAETVDFYVNVLEMPLIRSMDYMGGGQHFFFDAGNGASVAFFYFPDAPDRAPGIASQHYDFRTKGIETAVGSMNHVSLHLAPGTFDSTLERLKGKGVDVWVIDHDDSDQDPEQTEPWVRSMYFFDPNGIKLELSVSTRDYRASDVFVAPVNRKGERVALPA